jgi:hypothetical protein
VRPAARSMASSQVRAFEARGRESLSTPTQAGVSSLRNSQARLIETQLCGAASWCWMERRTRMSVWMR